MDDDEKDFRGWDTCYVATSPDGKRIHWISTSRKDSFLFAAKNRLNLTAWVRERPTVRYEFRNCCQETGVATFERFYPKDRETNLWWKSNEAAQFELIDSKPALASWT